MLSLDLYLQSNKNRNLMQVINKEKSKFFLLHNFRYLLSVLETTLCSLLTLNYDKASYRF